MQIEIKTDLKAWSKGMRAIQTKQIPFAIATALTMTAGRVGKAWQDEMRQQLDRPTPFTVNAVGVRGARKSSLVATVYVKDIAAHYLEPFVDGGPHFLGAKKGLLTPKNLPLNAYGNLPKSKLATLKGKPGVFIGPVRLKSGQIVNGVWQRKGAAKGRKAKGAPLAGARSLNLMIRFTDPQPVKQHLAFKARAEAAVRAHFEHDFATAFAHAMATAK